MQGFRQWPCTNACALEPWVGFAYTCSLQAWKIAAKASHTTGEKTHAFLILFWVWGKAFCGSSLTSLTSHLKVAAMV